MTKFLEAKSLGIIRIIFAYFLDVLAFWTCFINSKLLPISFTSCAAYIRNRLLLDSAKMSSTERVSRMCRLANTITSDRPTHINTTKAYASFSS